MPQDCTHTVRGGVTGKNHRQRLVKVSQDLVRCEEILDSLKCCRLAGPQDSRGPLI